MMLHSDHQEGHSRRLLIVDDDPDVARLLIEHLSELPAEVCWSDDGERGLEIALREGPWDAVVLDPPKLILGRNEEDEADGYRKYVDLNQLAISLVKPGGLFMTCSCSGLLEDVAFEKAVIKAAHRQARKLQFFDRTGAGADHPVMSNCLESRYLKVLWARVI